MMFEIEDFYSQKRGTKVVTFEPREEFEILDCSLLSSRAESAAYCTNSKTPYVRVCPSASTQSDKGMRLYRGVGWTIDASGEYAAATKEERNSQYPIAAQGYAAFLLSKVVYNKKKNKFSFIASDDVLEREYFNNVLQDVLLPDREDEKLEYRFGYFSRSDCFNKTLVDLVNQKLKKFKETNTESASQNVLQGVLELFSGDKEKYEKFMQEVEYITTSCGYKRLLDEINKFGYKKKRPRGYIRRSFDVLAQHRDIFRHLGNCDSYRKG